jgi:nicotinamidase-related amidase
LGAPGLKFGPLEKSAFHVSVDMQRIFTEATPWHTPWMKKILPQVCALAERKPENTVFTRFVPPPSPQAAQGAWKRYYERWAIMTLEKLDRGMVDLVSELKRSCPPAAVLDKKVYSPWFGTDLHAFLQDKDAGTLLFTGGETDVCLMAAVSGAVDLGYRVIIIDDAICSSLDETHEPCWMSFTGGTKCRSSSSTPKLRSAKATGDRRA